MMRTDAGLHPDQAWRHIGEPRLRPPPPEIATTAQHRFTGVTAAPAA
jgi:hypothetical protein